MKISEGFSLKELLMGTKCLSEEARKAVEEHHDEYIRLIEAMARRYVRNRVEYDDLVQEALIGLILACRDFDPSRSDDFRSYAIVRMKGKMYEYCIGNENPIYVPTHIAKAASYAKQMQRLLGRESAFSGNAELIASIIVEENHEREKELPESARAALRELKRKLGNIAGNSKTHYKRLATMAMESLSMMVSDDVLSKYPKETAAIEEIVSNKEVAKQLEDVLGEKKFTALSMWANGWTMQEIAGRLAEMGYTNSKGEEVTRQAIYAMLEETLSTVHKLKIIKDYGG